MPASCECVSRNPIVEVILGVNVGLSILGYIAMASISRTLGDTFIKAGP